jgi:hypothetical protein
LYGKFYNKRPVATGLDRFFLRCGPIRTSPKRSGYGPLISGSVYTGCGCQLPRFKVKNRTRLDFKTLDKLPCSSSGNKGLEHWPTMPQPQQNWDLELGNRLIREQLNYDAEEQTRLADEHIPKLNEEQRKAFDEIVEAVNTKSGQIFFLHGPGGTGKTYIYNTLCCFLHGQHKIIICVASSGIAALLIIGGRTSHSCFKIPINI